jgi:Protein of unknown function (DUF3592)
LDPSLRLTITLAASAAAVFATAGIFAWVRRLRRQSPEELERARRLEIYRSGRITTGQIVDLIEPEAGKPGPRLLVYTYEIASARYEVPQDIAALPAVVALARRRVGRTVSVRYNPRVPTNSIVACEEWSGVPEAESQRAGEKPAMQPAAEVVEKS